MDVQEFAQEMVKVYTDAGAHPLRMRFLIASSAEDKGLSPVEFVQAGVVPGTPLGTIAYHVRCLDKAKLVALWGEERRRGAVVHFYGPTLKGWDVVRRYEAIAARVRA